MQGVKSVTQARHAMGGPQLYAPPVSKIFPRLGHFREPDKESPRALKRNDEEIKPVNMTGGESLSPTTWCVNHATGCRM